MNLEKIATLTSANITGNSNQAKRRPMRTRKNTRTSAAATTPTVVRACHSTEPLMTITGMIGNSSTGAAINRSSGWTCRAAVSPVARVSTASQSSTITDQVPTNSP